MSYNLRNPGVKRLMREAAELKDPTELFWAQPLELLRPPLVQKSSLTESKPSGDNLFEWHFTVRGPPETQFEGGIYHGRIILPVEYPMKPPSIMILTPNGRFETNKKICLSISGHHPESWQPSWSIRTALLAIIGFMPTHGAGAIGSLDYSPEERRTLAQKSQDWKCNTCNTTMRNILPPVTEASKETTAEAHEIATQIAFKEEQQEKENPEVHQADDTSPADSETDTGRAASATSPSESPAELRQRHVESVPPLNQDAAPFHQAFIHHPLQNRNEENSGSGSFVMIIILSLMIAALLFRRLYMINEWRFYPGKTE